MSDWDLIDKKANVPRNDPKIDRRQSFAEAESHHVHRAGIKVYSSHEKLSRESGAPSRKPEHTYTSREEARLASQKLNTIKKLSPKEMESRRRLKEYLKNNGKGLEMKTSKAEKPQPIVLNFANVVAFLVAASFLGKTISHLFSGALTVVAYIFLWIAIRAVLKKMINENLQ